MIDLVLQNLAQDFIFLRFSVHKTKRGVWFSLFSRLIILFVLYNMSCLNFIMNYF